MGSRKTADRPVPAAAIARCFNGAATMGSRKTLVSRCETETPPALQWGRDDGVAEDGSHRSVAFHEPSFNGAATMGSRKTRLASSPGCDVELQWGRDDGVAEDGPPSSPLDCNRLRTAPREVTR